ncbi:hypothetical protein GCM10010430_55680 [Kitasatospora cystarginea]|uniref:Uncharacterized protein n=1 Tax=Kitasatospora cystarginea TaxID=58350 RepID=A0ABP5RJG3_9ACTN
MRYGYTDGHLASVYNSSGKPMRFANDSTGRILSWTDRNNSQYLYTYDQFDRVIDEGGADGTLRFHFTYGDPDPATGLKTHTETNVHGHTTTYTVNGHAQITAITDPHHSLRTWKSPPASVRPPGAHRAGRDAPACRSARTPAGCRVRCRVRRPTGPGPRRWSRSGSTVLIGSLSGPPLPGPFSFPAPTIRAGRADELDIRQLSRRREFFHVPGFPPEAPDHQWIRDGPGRTHRERRHLEHPRGAGRRP